MADTDQIYIRKDQDYDELRAGIEAVLDGETNVISIMSTLACMFKNAVERIYWVGFYLEDGDGVLKIGPYQGTLGCLTIHAERGVCGRAYRTGETQLVDDVHADPEHIACDAASQSELVIPVKRSDGSIYGVLDIDSDRKSAFTEADREFYEDVVRSFLEPYIDC